LQTVQRCIDLRELVQHLSDGIDQETKDVFKSKENSMLLRDVFLSAINSWCIQKELAPEDLDAKLLAALDTFASYLPSTSRMEALKVLMSVLQKTMVKNAQKLSFAIALEV
jgi:hypothetical protein